MPDKRFLLFGMASYYPCGGMDDLYDSYDTAAEAITAAHLGIEKRQRDWFSIYDCEERKAIEIPPQTEIPTK